MMQTSQFLPGTGRRTSRRLVEGGCRQHHPLRALKAPTTAFGGPPPRAGEELL
jgi:hypothetical protein